MMEIYTHNKETNMVIKSYNGDIPFTETSIKNIKEVGASTTGDNLSGEVSKYEPGRFSIVYKIMSITSLQENLK